MAVLLAVLALAWMLPGSAAEQIKSAPVPAGIPGPACCTITDINAQAGLVTAKVNSSGQLFQFRVTDSAPLNSLHIGRGIYANFITQQVSVNGLTPCCPIVPSAASAASAESHTGKQPVAPPPAAHPSLPPLPPSGGTQPPSGSPVFVPSPQGLGPSVESITASPGLIFGRATDAAGYPHWPREWVSYIAVNLNRPAPDGGTPISVTIDQPGIAYFSSDGIPVPAGQKLWSNNLWALPVLTPTQVHVIASAGSLPAPKATTITVWPPFLDRFGTADKIESGRKLPYNLLLKGGAPAGGFLVQVNSSNPNLIAPRKILIPENSREITDIDYAPSVSSPSQVTLTAQGYIPRATQPSKGPKRTPDASQPVEWVPEMHPPAVGFPHHGPPLGPWLTQTVTIVPLNLVLSGVKLICPPPTGRVVLNERAARGGIQIELAASDYVRVPPYVTVPENFDTGDFPVSLPGGSFRGYAGTFSATYNGVTKQRSITIQPDGTFDCDG